MTLGKLADLATVIVAGFVILAAVPAVHLILQWEWRWRLGAWTTVLHTNWSRESHGRDRDSETRKEKLLWIARRVFRRPVRFLTRLSNSNWEVTRLYGSPASLTVGSEIHLRESKARNEAQIRSQRASERMFERQYRRKHKRVMCSNCGKESTQFLCHPDCEQVADPREVGHVCDACVMEEYHRHEEYLSTANSQE